MIALPVIEIVKFHINPAQGPDIISNVPFIEVDVQLALKEAISYPETISASCSRRSKGVLFVSANPAMR